MNSILLGTIVFLKSKGHGLFLAFPFIPISICFLLIYKSPFYLIKSESPKPQAIELSTNTDNIQNGNSTIHILKNNGSELEFKYKLGNAYTYPYVVSNFHNKNEEQLDLAGYDFIRVKIKAEKGVRIPICLWTNNNKSKTPDEDSRPSQFIVNVSREWGNYKVPFKELYTPEWWYTVNKKLASKLPSPDYSKVESICFSNCINIKPGIEDMVSIQEVSFHSDLSIFYLGSGIFLLFYYGLAWIATVNGRKKNSTIHFQFEPSQIDFPFNEKEKIAINYITSNYHNAELSIDLIEKETGLSEKFIGNVLKRSTDLSFKQFLNQLRIAEAKRLLKETDLNISEIAFKVGYGNVTHFNRVFKSLEDITPNDFRKKQNAIV